MPKLDLRWYKEDRDKYSGDELVEQMAESEKAINNSTIVTRRLKDLLEEDIRKTYLVEESLDNPAWERLTIAAAAERKVLRRIIKLLP